MTYTHKCNLHAIAVALLALLGRVTGVNNIMEYCEKIVESRKEDALYLLPGLIDPERDMDSTSLNLPHLMIDKVRKFVVELRLTLHHPLANKGELSGLVTLHKELLYHILKCSG